MLETGYIDSTLREINLQFHMTPHGRCVTIFTIVIIPTTSVIIPTKMSSFLQIVTIFTILQFDICRNDDAFNCSDSIEIGYFKYAECVTINTDKNMN
jgi:hypothetical protein